MDHLRVVEPIELVAVAAEDHDSVLLSTFDPPLDTAAVKDLVAELSHTPVEPDTVDVREVAYVPSVKDSTALSLDRLSSHTDGAFLATPPPRFLLSCSRADEGGGGISTFVPVDGLLAGAPEWVVDGLAGADFRFLKTYDGDLTDSFVGPVLVRRDDGRWLMRWRADHIYRPEVVEDNGTRGAEAVAWLHERADRYPALRHTLCEGQLALIPNGRYLHGRTALTADSTRCILRAWVF